MDKIRTKPPKRSGNGGSSKCAPAYPKNAAPPNPNHAPKQGNQKCNNCGGDFPHRSKCPATGVECHYCHKRNHFISVCRKRIENSRRQHLREIADVSDDSETELKGQSDTNYESDPEVAYGLKTDKVSHINSKVPCMPLKINDVETNALIRAPQ